jgi:hypothetical protein
VVGDGAIEIAVARVSIPAMHVTGGVGRIDADRLVMIRDGILEVPGALTLVGAIAVDDRKIVPVIATGFDGARASLDCGLTGSPYANLAVVRGCRSNKPCGGNGDSASTNQIRKVVSCTKRPRCLVKSA